MKAEFDKEMDALLRRNARAAGRGARASLDAPATPHLDADELSAFAEDALPAPARLGAVSHLADCDVCRGAVVSLSRAAGAPAKRAAVPASVDPSEAAPAGGWLAALFSPRLLRFVAPALALCLVGAVAFVLLRTQREGGSVAQRSPARETISPGLTGGAAGDTQTGANANTSTDTAANMSANVAPPAAVSAETSPGAGQERPAAPAANEAPDGSDVRAAGELAREQPAEVAAKEDAPPPPPISAPVAEAPPAASAPAPAAQPPTARDAAKEKKEDDREAVAEDELARVDERQQQQRRARQLGNLEAQQAPDDSRSRSANNTYGGARPAPAAPRRRAERSGRSVTGPRAGSAAGGGAEREEAAPAGETRAAAGHRFRREGSAWVDVNYRSTMAMTGVRRGTEAFRALVADIPELGRVAEQLPGEVITVVGGRAYRIR